MVDKTTPTEHIEQVTYINWFKLQYPKHRLFSVPNAGKRSYNLANHAKAEGLSSGVPDLMIPHLFLFIEMKRTKGGRVSKEQKEWIEYLNTIGYLAVVCNGFEEAKNVTVNRTKTI